MKNIINSIILLTLLIAQPYRVDANGSFLVDCRDLDESALISEKSRKFDRVEGDYYLKVQVFSLDEYGFKGIQIPKFDFDKTIKLSPPMRGIKFLPEHEDEDSGDEVGVTIGILESSYKTREHLKSILSPSAFETYKDFHLFEIIQETLGVHKDVFTCEENVTLAMSRFVSSIIWPLSGSSVTYVYYIENFNALILSPIRSSFGEEEIETIRMILPNGPDGLTHIFITAKYSIIDSFLDCLEKRK
jgi:hypothetical protein